MHFKPFARQLQVGSLHDLVHEQDSSSSTAVLAGFTAHPVNSKVITVFAPARTNGGRCPLAALQILLPNGCWKFARVGLSRLCSETFDNHFATMGTNLASKIPESASTSYHNYLTGTNKRFAIHPTTPHRILSLLNTLEK